jgi:hypothetical protein
MPKDISVHVVQLGLYYPEVWAHKTFLNVLLSDVFQFDTQ